MLSAKKSCVGRFDAVTIRRGLYGGEIPLLKFRAMCIGASQMTASFSDSQRGRTGRISPRRFGS